MNSKTRSCVYVLLVIARHADRRTNRDKNHHC